MNFPDLPIGVCTRDLSELIAVADIVSKDKEKWDEINVKYSFAKGVRILQKKNSLTEKLKLTKGGNLVE